MLLSSEEMQKIWILRKVISDMDDVAVMEMILDQMKKSKTNEVFLNAMNTGSAAIS